MKKRVLLFVLYEVLAFGFAFGLGVLLYFLGEGDISLGSSMEEVAVSLPYQLRVGHLIEANDGELVLFYEGSMHSFHVFSVGERVQNALRAAFSINFGECLSTEAPVIVLLGPSLVRSLLMHVAALTLLPLSYVLYKKVNPSKKAMLILAIVFLFAGIGCSFTGLYFLYSPLVLGAAISFALWWYRPEQNNMVRMCFAGLGFTLTLVLLASMNQGTNGGLSSLFFHALSAKDNHLYAVTSFFLLQGILTLAGSFFFTASPRREREA